MLDEELFLKFVIAYVWAMSPGWLRVQSRDIFLMLTGPEDRIDEKRLSEMLAHFICNVREQIDATE